MFKKYLYIILLGLFAVSCSEDTMDNINKDEANPPAATVDAKYQITDAIMSTGFTTWSGAYAWYVASYTEQIFGTGNNQLMKAELRQRTETAASTTFNNEWNGTYANLMNISQIIQKCSDGGLNQGQYDILGMAQVLWVLNVEALTDLHGDIPCSEAGAGISTLQPKLDKQQDIYNKLFTTLESAKGNLSLAIEGRLNNAKGQDILFGGDSSKWLALANAIKARLLLNTLFRDPDVLSNVLIAANDAITGGFEGAEISAFNGVDCDNPWTAFFRSRVYSGACKTVVDLMSERNDPRAEVYSFDYFESGVTCAPAGDASLAGESQVVGIPTWLDNGAATLHLMSKSELYFILAEAKARLGQDASADFAIAVTASFDDFAAADPGYTAFDPSSSAAYITSLGTPTLKEIMIQKYISQCRDEQIMAYNDIRRCRALNETFVELKNPNNVNGGQNQWPLRLAYGNSDVVSNPNVAAAFGSGNNAGNYLFTENIWLYGGSR